MIDVNNIYSSDCFDFLEKIQDNSIDIVFTDPPYNITSCEWDKEPINFKKLMSEYKRVVKENGYIIMFGNNPFSAILIANNLDIYKYSMVWVKPNSTSPNLAKIQPMRRYEDVIVFCKGNGIYNPIKMPGTPYRWNSKRSGGKTQNINYEKDKPIENNGWRYPTNVLEFKQERGYHPTQKPVSLCEHILRLYTNENDLMLDTFSGSGSLCLAAKRINRRYIGCELDENMVKISKERLI